MFLAYCSVYKVFWANQTSKHPIARLPSTGTNIRSASPLNAQAAELWDSNQEEFKRHVLARHQDLDDE